MAVLENTCLEARRIDNKCIKVLLIEDNPDHYYLIREMLTTTKDAIFDTERVDRLSKGLECLGEKKYDVVLTDLSLPDSLGINTFNEVRTQAPDVPVIVLSALDDEEFALEAVQAGAQDYLVKGQFNGYLLGRAIFYAIERKRSEEQYRKLYEYSVAALWKISIQDGKFLKANLPTAKLLGFNSTEDLIENSTFNDICCPEQRKKLLDKLRVRGEVCGHELLFTLKDGTKKYVTACIKIYPEKGYLEGSFVDITKRKHIEEKIEQSYQIKSAVNSILQISLEPIPLEKLLERVLDIALSVHWLSLQSRGAIFLVEEDDPQMLVLKVQRGLSPTQLMHCTKIPFGKCLCGRAAASHKIEFGNSHNNRHEITFRGIDQHSHYCVPILFGNKVLGVMVLYSDAAHTRKEEEEETLLAIARALSGIIERKRGEEVLKTKQQEIENLNANLEKRVQEEVEKSRQKDFIMMHQSRLAAMGEMIGNIAHQWKQPLNALVFLLYNIQDSFESNELTESELDNWIKKGDKLIRKMASTVDDFRSFFKPNKAKEVFCVNKIIKDSLSLVDAAFKQNSISVVVNETEETNIFGFANEYSQVILNILNNAKDAIIAKGIDGEIKIDITHENKFNVLKIKDNGGGIPEEIKNRIFEPYFTTKQEGRGTGIGLYMSKVIIEDHMNGYVEVQNDNGGAEFRITTPSAQ